jgi:hypothetical protein
MVTFIHATRLQVGQWFLYSQGGGDDISTKAAATGCSVFRFALGSFYILKKKGSQSSCLDAGLLALYQGTTLVGPYRSERELGFSL